MPPGRSMSALLLCGALALAVEAPAAHAALYRLTFTGAVGPSSDGPANLDSVFGPKGSLEGRPFVLTVTIDDTLGVESTAALSGLPTTRRESLAGDRPVIATLQINGIAVPIGAVLPVTEQSEIARGYSPAFGSLGRSIVAVAIGERSVESTGPSAGSRELLVQISNDSSSSGTAPFADSVDWRTPFTRDLVPDDSCSPPCTFDIRGANAAGQRYQANGRLLPTSMTFEALPSEADVPLPLWMYLLLSSAIGGAAIRLRPNG